MKDNCGFCPFCMKSPTNKSDSCELVRSKLSRQKFKERKRNFERKYTLTQVLSERDATI